MRSDFCCSATPATYDLAPALARHPVPITIIQGDHDYADPAAITWHELAASDQAHIEVLHDAGHYAWIDAPGAFESALRAGLARTRLTALLLTGFPVDGG